MANVRRKEEEHTLQSAMEWFGANFQPRNNWTEIQKILLMVCLFHSFFLFSSISVNWTERMVFSKNSKKKQNSIWNHLDSILNIIWSSVQGWKNIKKNRFNYGAGGGGVEKSTFLLRQSSFTLPVSKWPTRSLNWLRGQKWSQPGIVNGNASSRTDASRK